MATDDERLVSIDRTQADGAQLPATVRDEIIAMLGVQSDTARAVMQASRTRGEWSDSASYLIGDLVTYQGSLFNCLEDHAGDDQTPDTAPERWSLAARGLSSDPTEFGEQLLAAGDDSIARDALGALGLVQAAKNPDLLIAGSVTVDSTNLVTGAQVVWPDGSPGTLTITSRDSNGAVLSYNITYGSPVTKTFTQPAITRNSSGVATNVPAIVVS